MMVRREFLDGGKVDVYDIGDDNPVAALLRLHNDAVVLERRGLRIRFESVPS